jgi:hypothetical protein
MGSGGKRFSGRTTQVDICPFEVGFIVSIGRVTVWIGLEEAEDLLEVLGRALMVEASGDDMREAETDLLDSEDVHSDPTSSRPIPSFRGPRKN